MVQITAAKHHHVAVKSLYGCLHLHGVHFRSSSLDSAKFYDDNVTNVTYKSWTKTGIKPILMLLA